MKRNTDALTKFNNLKVRLGIKRYEAIGILEGLWHLCARETPQGNIGKLTDQEIATYLEWPGDPALLIQGLVATRWMDTSDQYRLVVHEWWIHCEDSVHMSLARSIRLFCNGSMPKLTRLSKKERPQLEEALIALKYGKKALAMKIDMPLFNDDKDLQDSCAQTGEVCALPSPTLPSPTIPYQASTLPTATAATSSPTPKRHEVNNNGKDEPQRISTLTPEILGKRKSLVTTNAWDIAAMAMRQFGINDDDVRAIIKRAIEIVRVCPERVDRHFVCDFIAITFQSSKNRKVNSLTSYVCAWLNEVAEKKDAYKPDESYRVEALSRYDKLSGVAR